MGGTSVHVPVRVAPCGSVSWTRCGPGVMVGPGEVGASWGMPGGSRPLAACIRPVSMPVKWLATGCVPVVVLGGTDAVVWVNQLVS